MLLPRQLLASTLLLSPFVAAQENFELGKMWTFENPPLAYLEAEYGFTPDEGWLNTLRMASIRFGSGCSSSFVSPKGLIMTNHHCVRDKIAESQGEYDWVKDGFYAAGLTDEVKLPGLTVQQLESMRDITAEMTAGIIAGGPEALSAGTLQQNEAKIIAEAEAANPELDHEVVKLFQGAVYQLYSYRIWDDIRLVVAPHLQTSHFGGDPDNFTYPRYGIDFAFCRAYVDGAPADTSGHYFKWNTSEVKEGDLVFVTGNPGTTKRLLTKSQLEYMRDTYHPIVNEMIDRNLEIREKLVEEQPELEKEMRTDILSWENSQKAYRGYYEGLLDESLMQQKEIAERAFREKVTTDEELNARFGGAWLELEKLATMQNESLAKLQFYTPGGHPLIDYAIGLAQLALPGIPEQIVGQIKNSLLMAHGELGEMSELEKRSFIDHLERAQKWLPEGDPYLAVMLGDKTPAEALEAINNSRLTDKQFVDELIAASPQSVADSKDPALVAASALLPMLIQNQQLGGQITEIEEAQGALIGQALHAVYGNKVSPDATFTLRFSDGVVSGFPMNGTIAPFATSFYGLYARNSEFNNEYPFNLPQIWLDRRDKIDMTKKVDLVSTNDIIGGNSGSPLVSKDLEIVGLVFDGNIEMLPNRYLYRSGVPRSVSVHVDSIMESLTKIYDAQRIADELLGK
ncbi:MAG: S46 family peptidase [Planctomycetota bacterium]|jgi:hypothetical protein